MKWLAIAGAGAVGALLASRPARDEATRFARDIRLGMDQREAQLRESLALDTGLTLRGERADGGAQAGARAARAIEGR
ncbi:hypothetical protein HJ588_18605 [Flexivirga sp. ID2601S]|uniref:Uncharacterized protein n=1 Tax=Flexivirga aerilata TaxID=1656889 RepID=A0A849AKC0_9MICO|nr:hypothetical protein [Flexivirga aerilata]NNG41274.1 hypothetical protein [Flexivirga aerilata]